MRAVLFAVVLVGCVARAEVLPEHCTDAGACVVHDCYVSGGSPWPTPEPEAYCADGGPITLHDCYVLDDGFPQPTLDDYCASFVGETAARVDAGVAFTVTGAQAWIPPPKGNRITFALGSPFDPVAWVDSDGGCWAKPEDGGRAVHDISPFCERVTRVLEREFGGAR